MSLKPSTSLPPEIWNNILQQCISDFDLDEQWMSLRLVCSRFKSAVEKSFVDRHLQHMFITYNLGTSTSQNPLGIRNSEMVFPFMFRTVSRYRGDGHIALFHTDVQEDLTPDLAQFIRRRLEKVVQIWSLSSQLPGSIGGKEIALSPFHTIHIYDEINDMPLPGLYIDSNSFDLILDWKALLTRFYGEKRAAKHFREWKPTRQMYPRACKKVKSTMQKHSVKEWNICYTAVRRERIDRMFRKQKVPWSWKGISKEMASLEKEKLRFLGWYREDLT